MGNGGSAVIGRIMVVDDDVVTARFMAHVLGKRGGFEVRHVPDARAALEAARSQAWDLVITDVEMPGMTGLELLRALREISPDLPVAVITGHASLDMAVEAIRSDADEFLEKPVHPDELIAIATALVNKGQAGRGAAREAVLAVGAHPDDVEIGAGGTLLAHKRLGDAVSILTLSPGARGDGQLAGAAESRRAAEIIGADLYLGELEDTHIAEGEDTVATVARVLARVRPTVIYTHSLHDVHTDHRNAHRAVMAAAAEVARVFCFQSHSATVDFRPSRFVAIDADIDRKLAAIGAFASQIAVRRYLDEDLIRSTARYWSRFGDSGYAEAFEVIRDIRRLPGRVPPATAAVPGAAMAGESRAPAQSAARLARAGSWSSAPGGH
jgi:LmbE family N-acetylglucosaminyl deacetylase/ActR/RegA family two-component response regulator